MRGAQPWLRAKLLSLLRRAGRAVQAGAGHGAQENVVGILRAGNPFVDWAHAAKKAAEGAVFFEDHALFFEAAAGGSPKDGARGVPDKRGPATVGRRGA